MNNQPLVIVEMFDGLKSLRSQTKEQLRDKVIFTATQLSLMNLWRRRVNQPILLLFKFVWRLAIIFPIVYFANRFGIKYSLWEWIGLIGLIFGAQYLLYSVTLIVTSFFQSFIVFPNDSPSVVFQKFIWAFLFTNSMASVIYILGLLRSFNVYWQKPLVESHIFALTIILINPLTIYGCQLLFTVFTWIVALLLEKSSESKNPDIFINALFLNALFMVENYPNSLANIEFKRFLGSLMERVANLIRYSLPSKLKTGDRSIDLRIKNDFAKVSAAIRDMHRDILMTNPKDNEMLVNRLAANFQCLMTENYDQLEQIDLDESASMFSLKQAGSYVWKFLLSCLPLAVVVLVQNTEYALEGNFAQVLYFISTLNIVLLLLSFDPQVNDRLIYLREFSKAVKYVLGKDNG